MTTFMTREATVEDGPAIRHLVFEVLQEYGLKPDPGGTDLDLQDTTLSYGGRGGSFRVIVDKSGQVVGCGGLYPLNQTDAEIRKMYLLPSARGKGLGKQMLRGLVDFAIQQGFDTVSLETASVLKEAISLYRSFGFEPTCRGHLASRCDQAFVLTALQQRLHAGKNPPAV